MQIVGFPMRRLILSVSDDVFMHFKIHLNCQKIKCLSSEKSSHIGSSQSHQKDNCIELKSNGRCDVYVDHTYCVEL